MIVAPENKVRNQVVVTQLLAPSGATPLQAMVARRRRRAAERRHRRRLPKQTKKPPVGYNRRPLNAAPVAEPVHLMADDPSARRLLAVLRRARLALVLRAFVRALVLLAVWVTLGVATAALCAWLGWMPARLRLVAVAGLAVAAVLALADALRFGLEDAALVLDLRLGLAERASTALEAVRAGRQDSLARRVVAEAAAGVRGAPLRLLPYALGRRLAGLTAAGLVLAAILALPPRATKPGLASESGRIPAAAGRKLAEYARRLEAAARQVEPLPPLAKLSRLGQDIATGKTGRAESLERLRSAKAESRRLALRSPSTPAAPHLDRALATLSRDAATAPLAEALRSGDAESVKQAIDEMARSMAAGGFDQKSLAATTAALAELSQALAAAGRGELARAFDAAAGAARGGDLKALAKALKEASYAQAMNDAAGLQGSRAELRALNKLIDNTEAMLGVRGETAHDRDWGVGTSSGEVPPTPVGARRLRDRQASTTSAWTADYAAKHPARMLEGGKFEATRLAGVQGEGALSYVEFRALPGPVQPSLAREVAPGTAAEGTEEALSRDEIPAGYREEIKRYFDKSR